MKVCVAEKPSVAREIASILGATTKRDGYFEGNGYAVSWTFGHFCSLKAPDDYQPHWKRWDLNTLPMLPPVFEIKLREDSGVQKQFRVLQNLFQQAEVVINCGDAGQEGELIQRWVLKEAKYQGPVQRLWISSLTAEAIRDGFSNLQDGKDFDNLYYAGFSRAIGDWLLGMNATRLYTLKYGGYKQVLSIGRVQTPTLAMLVKRHYDIVNFKPEPFWELQTLYREVQFNCTKGRFTEKEKGEELLAQVEGHPFTIISADKKNGKEGPPRLFDLTSLQVHCNKRFGNSADQTLKIAQKLYEQKVITYPRVDTTYLPNDLYPKINGILSRLQQYQAFTQPLLGKKIRKSAKVFNDKKVTDHHAMIPTGVERSLGPQEQRVYDAIARRFIAAFYPDCLVANTLVKGEANEVAFTAKGKEILDPGWRVLYPKKKKSEEEDDKGNKKEDDKILPAFTVGESGPHKPSLIEKMTQPPKSYTEATLLRAMETAGKQVDDEELRDLMKANGIGRPSTRASIIETLFRRKYIQRRKKLILPTETGIRLIDTIQNDLLKSAELTGQWEKQLRDIESGEFSAKVFINEMKRMVDSLVTEVRLAAYQPVISAYTEPAANAKSTKKKAAKPKKSVLGQKCPKCEKGQLLKGKSAYGCNRYKEGCNFRLPFSFMEKKISDNQLLKLLQKGTTTELKGFKEGKEKLTGKVRFDDDYQLRFEAKPSAKADIPDVLRCPKCGLGEVKKGKSAYGCSRWQSGCDYRFTFEDVRRLAGDKKMTKALVWEILQKPL